MESKPGDVRIDQEGPGYILRLWPHRSVSLQVSDLLAIHAWCDAHQHELLAAARQAEAEAYDALAEDAKQR